MAFSVCGDTVGLIHLYENNIGARSDRLAGDVQTAHARMRMVMVME